MSSERVVRIHPVESLRIPEQGSSAQGKSGPKPRPKGVGDGQRVKNPVPPRVAKREAGTQEDNSSALMVERVQMQSRGRQARPPVDGEA